MRHYSGTGAAQVLQDWQNCAWPPVLDKANPVDKHEVHTPVQPIAAAIRAAQMQSTILVQSCLSSSVLVTALPISSWQCRHNAPASACTLSAVVAGTTTARPALTSVYLIVSVCETEATPRHTYIPCTILSLEPRYAIISLCRRDLSLAFGVGAS
jgi:hypothetical protein